MKNFSFFLIALACTALSFWPLFNATAVINEAGVKVPDLLGILSHREVIAAFHNLDKASMTDAYLRTIRHYDFTFPFLMGIMLYYWNANGLKFGNQWLRRLAWIAIAIPVIRTGADLGENISAISMHSDVPDNIHQWAAIWQVWHNMKYITTPIAFISGLVVNIAYLVKWLRGRNAVEYTD